MEHQFYVGQEVVCVNDGVIHPGVFNLNLHGLKKDEIYTIKEIYFNPVFGQTDIVLNEIIRPVAATSPTKGFWVGRFRPIVKTDISIFEAMLKPVKVDA